MNKKLSSLLKCLVACMLIKAGYQALKKEKITAGWNKATPDVKYAALPFWWSVKRPYLDEYDYTADLESENVPRHILTHVGTPYHTGTGLCALESGSYLTIPTSDDWDFGGSSFTIEFDVVIDSDTNGSILDAHDGVNGIHVTYQASANRIYYGVNTLTPVSTSTGLSLGTTYRFAIVYNQPDHETRFYLNGEVVSESTALPGPNSAPQSLSIGTTAICKIGRLHISKNIARYLDDTYDMRMGKINVDSFTTLALNTDRIAGATMIYDTARPVTGSGRTVDFLPDVATKELGTYRDLFQPVVGAQPAYDSNDKSLVFDGYKYLTHPDKIITAPEYTVYTTFRSEGILFGTLWSQGDTLRKLALDIGSDGALLLIVDGISHFLPAGTIQLNTNYVATVKQDATSVTLYLNGTQLLVVDDIDSGSGDSFFVGCGNGDINHLRGKMWGMPLIRDTADDDETRRNIEAQLLRKTTS